MHIGIIACLRHRRVGQLLVMYLGICILIKLFLCIDSVHELPHMYNSCAHLITSVSHVKVHWEVHSVCGLFNSTSCCAPGGDMIQYRFHNRQS